MTMISHRLHLRQLKNKKLLLKVISILLVILIIFFGCFICSSIQANAFVVAATVGMLCIAGAALVACGVQFASNEGCRQCAADVIDKLDERNKQLLEEQAAYLTEAGAAIQFGAEWWSDFFSSTVSTFGAQAASDSITNITFTGDSLYSAVSYDSSFTNLVKQHVTTTTSVVGQVGTLTYGWLGIDAAKTYFPSLVYSSTDYNIPGVYYINFGNGLQAAVQSSSINYTLDVIPCIAIEPSSNFIKLSLFTNALPASAPSSTGVHYFLNGVPIYANNLTSTNLRYHFTLSYADGTSAVADGYLGGLEIPSGVFDDVGQFLGDKFSQWLLDDIPSIGADIDTNAYPGVDTYLDDTDAWPYPGTIAVPGTIDGVIDTDIEDVRDGVIEQVSDPDKEETTDPTNPDSEKQKPVVPAPSLPEIIFKDKFPFCLPWDIYNLFVGLQYEGEAPKWVIPFKMQNLGIDETITIDLGMFDEQVKIIRFFLGAGFVLALILITRKILGAE